MTAVEHRTSELAFRRRVWREAGTAMEQAARLLVVAIVQEHAPEIMEVSLHGEYCEDGDLRLSLTGARADLKGVLDGDDLLTFVDKIEAFPDFGDALLDMVAGSGEDYLGVNTINITEEGKYA